MAGGERGEEESPTKLRLSSADGQLFEVDERVAFKSGTVRKLVEEVEKETAKSIIPLALNSNMLSKVLEFCKFITAQEEEKKANKSSLNDFDDDEDEEEDWDAFQDNLGVYSTRRNLEKESIEITKWKQEFLNVEQDFIFELMKAADYLDVGHLLELLSQKIADAIIECKDAEAIRAKFNISNDLSPAKVAEIKRLNTWAFE